MSSAICGGGTWGRGLFCCPVCKARRRGLFRLVFGGYGSDHLCGGCGTRWSDGEVTRPSKREAERNRALVRAEWPNAPAWRDMREAIL